MNVVGLVAFAIWTGAILSASGWLLERVLTGLRLPGRWVWLSALALSAWLPAAAVLSALAEPEAGTPVPPAGRAAVESIAAPVAINSEAGEGGVLALEVLSGWWTASNQLLASGADFIPAAEIAPIWIGALWGGSSLLVALLLGLSQFRLRRRAGRWPTEVLLGQPVKVSGGIGPATVGFITPRIVVPGWVRTLPEDELEMILGHEGEHVRSHDTLLLAAGLAAVAACPWNPLLWWQMRRLKSAVEVDCDRRVLARGIPPADYGRLLVALSMRARCHSLASPAIAGPTSLLERRLTLMKRMNRRTSVCGTLAASSLAILLLVVACSSEAPIATDTRSSAAAGSAAGTEPGSQGVVAIWIARDGMVQVNGVEYPIGRISEAVAPLTRPGVIASIEAHEAAPYRVVAAVQDELRAVDLLRVVFLVARGDAGPSASPDPSLVVLQGLPVVLPDTTMPDPHTIEAGQRNLMRLEVQPSGALLIRRGESPAEQRVEPRPERVAGILRQEVTAIPNLIALVRTHPDAEYRYMYDVLQGLRQAGATRFSLQVAE